jgi:hypothetical protein
LSVIFESATRGQRNDGSRKKEEAKIPLHENRFEVIVGEFFNTIRRERSLSNGDLTGRFDPQIRINRNGRDWSRMARHQSIAP